MSFSNIKMPKGETRTLRYQVKEDGAVKDITSMTFKFAVKEVNELDDSAYAIEPVDGTIDDAVNGKFSFALTEAMTDITPFLGRFSVVMYNASLNKTTLTPVGGKLFEIFEDIIEV